MTCTLYIENFYIPGLHDTSTGMCRTVNCQHGSVGCHPHQPRAQGVASVNHYMTIVGGTRKLVVNAVITNKRSGESITVPLHVDSCEVEELVLLPEDIVALNLSAKPSISPGVQFDGSTVSLAEYENVLIELQTDTSEVWRTSLKASVVSEPLATNSKVPIPLLHGVPGVVDTSRLLGYNGLQRLGIKQDFRHNKLVKVLRKI